jgi:deoxyguanosine kinase
LDFIKNEQDLNHIIAQLSLALKKSSWTKTL